MWKVAVPAGNVGYTVALEEIETGRWAGNVLEFLSAPVGFREYLMGARRTILRIEAIEARMRAEADEKARREAARKRGR